MHDISGGKEQELKSSRENEQSFPSCPLNYAPVENIQAAANCMSQSIYKGKVREGKKNHKLNSE